MVHTMDVDVTWGEEGVGAVHPVGSPLVPPRVVRDVGANLTVFEVCTY